MGRLNFIIFVLNFYPQVPSQLAFLRHKSAHAFTLIELLVVIAIIAVLAAIAFPVVKSALNSAKAAETVSNLKQVGVLAANYAADNNNRLPNSIDWGAYGGKPPGLVFFARSLAENAGFAYAQSPRTSTRPLPEIFYDPCLEGDTRQQHPMGAFGVNASILPSGSNGVPLAKIERPAQAVIFCSVASKGSKHSSEWGFTGNDFATKGLGADPCPDPRNAGKAAALFADGHVEKLDVKKMDESARSQLFARKP
jgi:prepilin-type N-terminal cleavage/methylation domain-containing protein/prepilin-type processing-associated H-X9-DG protein